MQNMLRDNRTPPTWHRWARFELDRLRYHLDRDIDPDAVSGPLFARGFANAASYLLLPLLAIVFASDVVSGEFAQGTIKLLLTRPVGRAQRARLEARGALSRDHPDRALRGDRRVPLRRHRVRIRRLGRARC